MAYIEHFPKPFLEDLIDGRCLPFVGAGFSLNGRLPDGKKMLAWDDLGRQVADSLPNYDHTNAVETLSAYSHEYSRVKLVETLSVALNIANIKPGLAHGALSRLPFERVVTTNWDFLLEESYGAANKYCMPILTEDQLALGPTSAAVRLLKMHGDFHHPNRMVITEDDYDQFLSLNPLLATHIASMLIDSTALFLGYSLDDPDFRQIWAIVKERLGGLRRPAYVLSFGSSAHARSRFERRGVKVIELPKRTSKSRDQVLAEVFEELREYWSDHLIKLSTATDPESETELRLPKVVHSRLVFFAVPTSRAAWYKRHIYPLAERWGFTPVMAIDVVSPGQNLQAKVQALIDRSVVVLVDLDSPGTAFEIGMLSASTEREERMSIFVGDAEEAFAASSRIAGVQYAIRPAGESERDLLRFVRRIDEIFQVASRSMIAEREGEPERLLQLGEYRAAVLAAFSLLEHELRSFMTRRDEQMDDGARRVVPLGSMLSSKVVGELIGRELARSLENYWRIRNEVAHSSKKVSAAEAVRVVAGVREAVARLMAN